MSKYFPIQLKAAFLLIVFALNTFIGFACVIGIDMGFNAKHHAEEVMKPIEHVHADGHKNEHHSAGSHKESKHKHNLPGTHTKDKKDDCCKDKVVKLNLTDKSLSKIITYNSPLVFPFTASFYYKDASFICCEIPKIKYFVRGYHPPIPDIRIAIQSFQI